MSNHILLNTAMEYVYRLNLPTIQNIFLDTFTGFNDDHLKCNYQYRKDLQNIIKPEWLNFRNYGWDHLLYFKKLDSVGRIHTDIGFNILNTPKGDNSTPWGITWVFEGDGLLEYWPFENIINDVVTNGSDNNHNRGVVQVYTSNVPPIKSYRVLKDNCYLVCGKIPHRARHAPIPAKPTTG